CHRRYASRDKLGIGEDVLIQAAGHSGASTSLRPVEEILGVHGDFHNVLAGSNEEFVHLGGAKRPYIIDGSGPVRTIKKFRRAVGVSVQRLVFKIVVIGRTES